MRVLTGNDAEWTQAAHIVRTWPMKIDVGVKLSARNRGETLRAEHTAGGGGGQCLGLRVGL